MRFREFQNDSQNDLAALRKDLDQAKNLAQKNPTLASKLKDFLTGIKNKVLSAVNQTPKKSLPNTQESTLEIPSELQMMDKLFAGLPPEIIKRLPLKKFRKDLNTILASYSQLKRSATKQYQDFYKASIDSLATKLDNSLTQIAKTSRRKEAQTRVRENLIETIKKVLAELHQEALLDTPQSQQSVLNFLNKLQNGFIPIDEVVGDGKTAMSGNIIQMAEKYLEKSSIPIWNKIGTKLMAATPQMAKGTSWGKGELGLALILQPASKGDKGDLKTKDGKFVEIKASEVAIAGGRFDIPGGNTSDQSIEYEKLLKKYFGPDMVHVVSKGKNKGYRYNLVVLGIKNLNNVFAQKKIKPSTIKDFLRDAILLTIDGEFKKNFKIDDKDLSAMLNGNQIDYENFLINLSKIMYGNYAQKEQYKIILVVNPSSGNYHVVNDEKQLAQSIKDKQIVASGGITYNLTQTKKTPQIGIN